MEIIDLYQVLLREYGRQGWWPLLEHNNEGSWTSSYALENLEKQKSETEKIEICIGAILTQNASWRNAEKALINLKTAGLLSTVKLKEIPDESLARLIRPSGYYNQKVKKIKAFIKVYSAEKVLSRDKLLKIWGLGPETVDDIMLYAYDLCEFVVDAYTRRLFFRLGFCDEKITYDALKVKIQGAIPKELIIYKQYHALIVEHGKQHCRKSPVCRECPLDYVCLFDKSNQ